MRRAQTIGIVGNRSESNVGEIGAGERRKGVARQPRPVMDDLYVVRLGE